MNVGVKGVMAGFLAGFLAISAPLATQAQSVGFEMRAGLIFSSGYRDTLELVYGDITGGYGWGVLGFGVRVPVAERFSIVPGADLLINYFSYAGDSSEDGFSTIILPSVNAKYMFSEGAGFYVQGGLNLGIVNMGSKSLDPIESDGVGFQILVGYDAGAVFFEGGIVEVPVKAEDGHYKWTEDFGGFTLRGGFGF